MLVLREQQKDVLHQDLQSRYILELAGTLRAEYEIELSHVSGAELRELIRLALARATAAGCSTARDLEAVVVIEVVLGVTIGQHPRMRHVLGDGSLPHYDRIAYCLAVIEEDIAA